MMKNNKRILSDMSAVRFLIDSCLPQALADYIVTALSDDPFFKELNAGFEPSDAVVAFCLPWVQGFEQLKSNGNAHLFWQRADVCSSLHDALGRINRICRCFLHLICIDLPSNPTRDEEVLSIANFKGQQVLEGAVRRILTDSKGLWSNEVNDLVKKGGTAALIGSKVENLETLLQISKPTSVQFRDMVGQMRETENAVRSRKVRSLRESFFNYFKKYSIMVRGGMEDSHVWWTSESIDSLLDGLSLVHDFPGALDERKQLQSWRTSQVKEIAQNDLMIVLNGSSSNQNQKIDFDLLSTCLQFCGEDPNSLLSMEVSEAAINFLVTGLPDLMDKASSLD